MRNGWHIKKLSEVCDLQNGFAFKSKSYVDHSNTLNIRMSNIRPNGSFDPEHNIKYLPDSFAGEYKQFLLQKDDLIIAMTDMAGEPKILGLPTIVNNLKGRSFLLNQRVGKLKDFSTDIHVPYLRYYLSSPKIKKYYKSKGAGGLQINISKKDILTAEIPVPTIKEQKRIVVILDESFSGIDAAIANTEKNLANARDLFLSKKYNLFKVIEKTAQLMPLPAICEEIFAGGDAPKGNYSKIETDQFKIPIFANAVKDAGLYGYTDFARAVKPSITVAARGSGTGHIELRREPFLPIVRLIVLTPDREKLTLEYLMHAIQNLDILRSGSAIPQLTVPMIKGYSIPVPTIIEQNQIVEKLEELSGTIVELESIYQQKLNSLTELKQSLLQKAFSGELAAEGDKLMDEAVA